MKIKSNKNAKQINRIDRFAILLLIVVGLYLFVSAPMPLEEYKPQGEALSVNVMFQIVAEENNKVRKQWTQHIVSAGTKAGLKFGENWRKKGHDEGPLPALFLREVAAYLEKSPVALSLFLGSDFPINSANKFKGLQAKAFQTMKQTAQHQYFFDNESKRYTAMFPDNVVVDACANCHNEHPETPKSDWKMYDMMGATTWAYPNATVTRDELMAIITALRGAFSKTYTAFLQKSQTFNNKPIIAEKWPVEGYFLPDHKVFMQRFEQLASEQTLHLLLQARAVSTEPP